MSYLVGDYRDGDWEKSLSTFLWSAYKSFSPNKQKYDLKQIKSRCLS